MHQLRCDGIVWIPFGTLVDDEDMGEDAEYERGRLTFHIEDTRDIYIDVERFAEGDSWDIEPKLHVSFDTTPDSSASSDRTLFPTLTFAINIKRRPEFYFWHVSHLPQLGHGPGLH